MSTFFWLCGVLGAIAFAINLAPQVYKCFKEKSAKQISVGFLILAFMGNIGFGSNLIYMNWDADFLTMLPIYFNYGTATTLTFILSIMKYKYDN